jgi:hypothetical protein
MFAYRHGGSASKTSNVSTSTYTFTAFLVWPAGRPRVFDGVYEIIQRPGERPIPREPLPADFRQHQPAAAGPFLGHRPLHRWLL